MEHEGGYGDKKQTKQTTHSDHVCAAMIPMYLITSFMDGI